MIFKAFDIKYMLRTSIKGQVLADLVAEFTKALVEEHIQEGKQVLATSLQGPSPWLLYVNGAANQRDLGWGW